MNVVTFRVGESRYAFPADAVSEVVEVETITHQVLAREGAWVGLACLHDRWIPVVELAGTLPDTTALDPDAESSVVLVLGDSRARLGLKVGELGEVLEMEAGWIRRDGALDRLVDVNGELLRYIDPAVLLASRADLLKDRGGVMEESHATAEVLQVVTFRVCDEDFGIDVMKVHEVLKVPDVSVVPKAPDFVEGVVGLRDSVLPVIDMRKRLSLPEREDGVASRLLVVEMSESRVALIVDDVPGVTELPKSAVSSAPEFFRGLAGRYLEGIAELDDRLVILLDLDEILTSKERIALDRMARAAPDAADSAGAAPTRKKGKKGGKRRTKKADK